MNAIPLADARSLHAAVVRTRIVGILAALALAGGIVAAALAVRDPHLQTIVPLPDHANAILVLDVSASISDDTYSRIGATLASLVRSEGRYGLVAFSDQAYEALPPGTPAADLKPLVRFFTLPPQKRPGFAQTFPRNPWEDVFTAGTRISAGLELARRISLDDRIRRPTVVLVSDLDDDPQDLPRLISVTLAFRRDHIPLRVIALNPGLGQVALFRRLIGRGSPIVQAGLPGPGPEPHNSTPFPWKAVSLALLAAALLAAWELWAPRLDWAAERAS